MIITISGAEYMTYNHMCSYLNIRSTHLVRIGVYIEYSSIETNVLIMPISSNG